MLPPENFFQNLKMIYKWSIKNPAHRRGKTYKGFLLK